jgi:ribosomal protein S12 methylthiotransferase
MYAYPSNFDDDLMNAYAECEKVVKYVDIPLQHSHKDMLKAMRRPVIDYRAFVNKLRTRIPNIAIRTTFIVGYPGETDEMFEDLYEFVKEIKFNKMGAFEFSKEKNTYAYSLPNQVPARIKKQRKNKLMKLQQQISYDVNQQFVGKTVSCIVEAIAATGEVVARSYADAPEVNGIVYIETDKVLVPGDIIDVRIVDCDEYNLFGEY